MTGFPSLCFERERKQMNSGCGTSNFIKLYEAKAKQGGHPEFSGRENMYVCAEREEKLNQ